MYSINLQSPTLKEDILLIYKEINSPIDLIKAIEKIQFNEKKYDYEGLYKIIHCYNYLSLYKLKIYNINIIGSGLNYKRKQFLNLIKLIIDNKVDSIYITNKDRLVRFGFELIEFLCQNYNTKIIIIDKENNLSPQQEMVNDLMSIIHVFSSKLYGLRKYKNKFKEMVEEKDNENS
jgi:predicted site-specific integrase-resolvase